MNPLIDFFETMAINAGMGAILIAMKNPDKATALKSGLGHLVDAICVAYGWTVTRP